LPGLRYARAEASRFGPAPQSSAAGDRAWMPDQVRHDSSWGDRVIGENLLELRRIRKDFGGFTALHDIDLGIRMGEFV